MQVFCVILQLFSICQRSLGYYANSLDFEGIKLLPTFANRPAEGYTSQP